MSVSPAKADAAEVPFLLDQIFHVPFDNEAIAKSIADLLRREYDSFLPDYIYKAFRDVASKDPASRMYFIVAALIVEESLKDLVLHQASELESTRPGLVRRTRRFIRYAQETFDQAQLTVSTPTNAPAIVERLLTKLSQTWSFQLELISPDDAAPASAKPEPERDAPLVEESLRFLEKCG